jgi:ABC-type transport system substrate-binding protein
MEEDPLLNQGGGPTSSVRFIAINPNNSVLAEPALRRVFLCAIARVPLRISTTWPFESFIPPENKFWQNPAVSDTCGHFGAQPSQIVDFLKAAGYSWQKEPVGSESGEGLILQDGTLFPAVTIMSPPEEIEPARMEVALYIEETARHLGIPLTVMVVSPEDLHYAVYSSGNYDMAIVAYRLSAYSGYLCDWFRAPGSFDYGSDRLRSACDSFDATADLETARQVSYEIQSILMEDLPFIPLYQVLRYEAYRKIDYPFDNVLDGISGLYGAPALAIPVP